MKLLQSQYINEVYALNIYENETLDGDKFFKYQVNRDDYNYPSIEIETDYFTNEVQVKVQTTAHGTLTIEEMTEHIEKLQEAMKVAEIVQITINSQEFAN